MKHLNILKTCPLFVEMGEEAVVEFCKGATVLSFNVKDTILEEKQGNDSLYILLEGAGQTLLHANDKKLIFQILQPGDCFGENFLVNSQAQEFEFRALSNLKILKISQENLRENYKKWPVLYGAFMTNLCTFVIQKFQILKNIIVRIDRENGSLIRTPIINFYERDQWKGKDREEGEKKR